MNPAISQGAGDEPPFADLLVWTLEKHGWSQQRLAVILEVKRASVNDWCRGRATPAPEVVFAIEDAIPIRPGALSRTLGYLPVKAAGAQLSTEDCIALDPELDTRARHLLLALYRISTGQDPNVPPPPAKRKKTTA